MFVIFEYSVPAWFEWSYILGCVTGVIGCPLKGLFKVSSVADATYAKTPFRDSIKTNNHIEMLHIYFLLHKYIETIIQNMPSTRYTQVSQLVSKSLM